MSVFYPHADGTMGRDDWRDIRNYQSFKIPILYLTGSIAGMTKDDKVTLNYSWKDRVGTCTAKWQGSSAAVLPGRYKNMTITFDTAFEVVAGWGVQKKYVLKANWVDPSQARNVVSAKLWGKMVKSRTPANAKLNALPNGGAIDGFPVIVSLNGLFYGLYTWNIPKDGWMFGMDESGQQFIVCAELNNNGAAAFKGLATFEADANGEVDFEVEFSSDDQTDWVLTSVNRLLAAVKDSDGTNIQYGITPYLDWDSAIDYYILSVLIGNYDGQWRNYLLYSYDGVKIGISAYDLDVVYGNRATGKYFHAADVAAPTFTGFAGTHKLFELIWTYMRPQLRARFNELVANILSEPSVSNEFVNFVHGIPLSVYVDNERLWPQIPSGASSNVWQIIDFYRMRLALAKEWIKDTSGEKSLPNQVDPDAPITYTVSNALTGCTTSNNATMVTEKTAYKATITAADGYTLDGATVSVKMGGVDITSTAYANGVISIGSVTGNVSITVTAAKVVVNKYTNQMPVSIGTDGEVYNGTGWKGRTRIGSSSGDEKDDEYCGVTGFIPVKSGDNVRFKDGGVNQWLLWNEPGQAYSNNIVYYNASFAWLGGLTLQPAYYGICKESDDPTGTTADGGIVTFTVPNNADIAYVRLSIGGVHSAGNDIQDVIVTVNEEITE